MGSGLACTSSETGATTSDVTFVVVVVEVEVRRVVSCFDVVVVITDVEVAGIGTEVPTTSWSGAGSTSAIPTIAATTAAGATTFQWRCAGAAL